MILAILTRIETRPSEKPFDKRYYINVYFKTMFEGTDILLFPFFAESDADAAAKICDGLIIPGSHTDINPAYYGQPPLPENNYEFDEFKMDRAFIRSFAEKGKPILGICGGMQSINVAFGGALHQKVNNHNSDGLRHPLILTEGSFIQNVFKCTSPTVNTYHNQAVSVPAPSFCVTAKSPDGTIEAIEKGNIIGVQWHPELENHIKLFRAFANLC